MGAKSLWEYESSGLSHVLLLFLVGGVNSIELAQQGRPFDLGWFSIAANGAIMGGADEPRR